MLIIFVITCVVFRVDQEVWKHQNGGVFKEIPAVAIDLDC